MNAMWTPEDEAAYLAWHQMLNKAAAEGMPEWLHDSLYATAECHHTACYAPIMPTIKRLLEHHKWTAADRADMLHNALCWKRGTC